MESAFRCTACDLSRRQAAGACPAIDIDCNPDAALAECPRGSPLTVPENNCQITLHCSNGLDLSFVSREGQAAQSFSAINSAPGPMIAVCVYGSSGHWCRGRRWRREWQHGSTPLTNGSNLFTNGVRWSVTKSSTDGGSDAFASSRAWLRLLDSNQRPGG